MDQSTDLFAGGMDHGKPTPAFAGYSHWARWAVAGLLAAHLWATCHVLPLETILTGPLLAQGDYPVHAHRAHVYRESFRQDGKPWGADPTVCGGIVLHPVQDIGSVPYQVLAILFPHTDAGRIVALFSWAAILAMPLALACAARLLDFQAEETAWGLVAAMAILWFAPPHRIMLEVGMIAFLLSSYLALLTLAAFVQFYRRPSLLRYLGAVLAGSLLFGVHPFGPVAIAPALLALTLLAPSCHGKWRLAAVAGMLPIAALNAFWLGPFLLGLATPPPPWMSTLQIEHPYWNWRDWSDLRSWFGPWLSVAHLTALALAGLALVGILRRRSPMSALALTLTLLTALLLFLFGSFWPITRVLQPVRFSVVLWSVLGMLGGILAAGLREKLRIPAWGAIGLLLVAVAVVATAFWRFAPVLANDRDTAELVDFVSHRTTPDDRLLVEAAGPSHWFVQALPSALGREVIGTAFPDHHDPLQFLPERLFGQSPATLASNEARRWIADFGVNWVVARSPVWQEYFARLAGLEGEPVGRYRAFHIRSEQSKFAVGAGELTAQINRIELRNVRPAEGCVVLRYRFHPGWVCDPPAAIEAFPTLQHSGGLLLIRNPPPNLVVRFDPRLALRSPWPDVATRLSGAVPSSPARPL